MSRRLAKRGENMKRYSKSFIRKKKNKCRRFTGSTRKKISTDHAFQHWRFTGTLICTETEMDQIRKEMVTRLKIEKKEELRTWQTCPPTTATEGRASQRDIPSPPWSPKTVQARWIRLTKPIKLSMVAIKRWKYGEDLRDFWGKRRMEWNVGGLWEKDGLRSEIEEGLD